MSITLSTVRRRGVVERRVLQIVRGEAIAAGHDDGIALHPPSPGPPAARTGEAPYQYEMVHFGCLREFARRNGLEIQPAGSQYLSSGELLVLRWLAEAQREAGLRSFCLEDVGLMVSLVHCAGILKGLGLSLPSHTLSTGCDPDGGASGQGCPATACRSWKWRLYRLQTGPRCPRG